jgi:SAM-dependent methyltransferase
VLEIGAGTGEDAKKLHESGYSVVATDISPGMLERAAEKLEGSPVRLQLVSAGGIPEAFPAGSFDVLFSNFGALNCVPNLSGLLPRLSGVLAPGGVMVVCLMGKYPLWETAASLARLRFRFRRASRKAVHARVGDTMVPVWYHSFSSLRSACRGWGDVVDVLGLNIVSPPPGSRAFRRRFPRLTSYVDRLDGRIGSIPVASTLGDHLVVVMRRTHGKRQP